MLLCFTGAIEPFDTVTAYGRAIGSFSNLAHDVTGDVYAFDDNSLLIRNFNYDGEGPGTYNHTGPVKSNARFYNMLGDLIVCPANV